MPPSSAPDFGHWCLLWASEVPGEDSLAASRLQGWLCRLSTAQEVLAEVVRRVEIKLVFHLPSYSPRGIVHPGERRLFFFFNLAQMHQ